MYEEKDDTDGNMLMVGRPHFEESSQTNLVNSDPPIPQQQPTDVSRKSDEFSEYHAESASNQSGTEPQGESKLVFSCFQLVSETS